MSTNPDLELERVRQRMQELFHDFYHTGTTGQESSHAGHNEQGASYARRADAAGGNHEYKD